MDASGAITTVELPVTSLQTVNLPNDYIQYTKIGVCDGRGNIIELGLNSNMCLDRSVDDCGNPIAPGVSRTSSSNSGYYPASLTVAWEGFSDNFRNGEFMGRFFGIGGGNNAYGYYRIDRANGVIQLGDTKAYTIVLEYIADLEQINGEFIVHPFVVNSLKEWMYWRSIAKNRSVGLGEKQLAEKSYRTAYINMTRRFNTSTIGEWYAALRKGNTAAPRF